jgi:hypothetical protein
MAKPLVRRDEFFGEMTPSNTRNQNVIFPQGTYIPAKWLPVAFTVTDRDAGSDAFVISEGKPVCFDSTGALVPAGYYWYVTKLNATTDNFVTYTATDVEWGVQDITTGEAVTAAVAYNAITVATALVERGLVNSTTIPSNASGCKTIFGLFFSLPVGLAPYDFYKYLGKNEDGDAVLHNYLKQSNVQFQTEKMLDVLNRAADSTTSDAFDAAAITTITAPSASGDFPEAGQVWTAAALAATTRFSLMGITSSKPVVALKLANRDVASVTDRTPFSCDDASVLVKLKASPAAIRSEGDYYIDHSMGIVFIHDDTWAALVADSVTATFSYYFYAAPGSITDVASGHRHVYFEGICRPGDRVGIDKQSNYVVAGGTSDVLPSGTSFGFVNFCEYEPYALMTHVKSAQEERPGRTVPATAKMPGTASKGFSDSIMKARETVADRHVIVTLRFL